MIPKWRKFNTLVIILWIKRTTNSDVKKLLSRADPCRQMLPKISMDFSKDKFFIDHSSQKSQEFIHILIRENKYIRESPYLL